MKICLISYKIYQSKCKNLPNTKRTFSKWPIVPKWRNFAKSGHSATRKTSLVRCAINDEKVFRENLESPKTRF